MAIEFECPHCSAAIRVPDTAAGKKGSCPACKAKLLVPQLEDSAESAAPPLAAKTKSSAKSKPDSAPEKRPAKSAPAAPEFDLGLQPAAPQKAEGKKKDDDFGAVLKLDLGLGAASAPTAKSKAPSPKAAKPIAATPLESAIETEFVAESDNDAPSFLQDPDSYGAMPVPEFAADAALPSQSTAAKFQRKQQQAAGSKAGLIFGLVCGAALIGGVLWYAMKTDIKMGGPRSAYAIDRGSALQSVTLDPDEFDIDPEASATVLKALKKHSAKATMDSMEIEFGASKAGFEISLRESAVTQFFRFPLDKELKEYREKHAKSLDVRRQKELKSAIKKFFEKCDVAIRNRETTLPLAKGDPREIGVNASLKGLGYHTAALVPNTKGATPYSCIYEDEANLYFLLPRNTKQFQVVGRYWDGSVSDFPGAYQVTVKAPKASAATEDEPDTDEKTPAKAKKIEAMEGEGESAEMAPSKTGAAMTKEPE